MKRLLPFLLSIITMGVWGQHAYEVERGIKRNNVYISGDWMTRNLSASLNYERLLLISKQGNIRISSSLGYGRWFTVDGKGSHYNMDFHFLAGSGTIMLEASTGLRCMDNEGHYFYIEPPEFSAGAESEQYSFFPNLNLGFRYQKPGGHLLFRTALGIPLLQISLGYQF
ncbi:MAG: hypothetical protein ABFS28_08500 [Bacteroidota bacterium]